MSLDHHKLHIHVTNEDICLAKARWLAAWQFDASNDRVCDLYDVYVQSISAQAKQIAHVVLRPPLRLVPGLRSA